jgi:hypothetical protein
LKFNGTRSRCSQARAVPARRQPNDQGQKGSYLGVMMIFTAALPPRAHRQPGVFDPSSLNGNRGTHCHIFGFGFDFQIPAISTAAGTGGSAFRRMYPAGAVLGVDFSRRFDLAVRKDYSGVNCGGEPANRYHIQQQGQGGLRRRSGPVHPDTASDYSALEPLQMQVMPRRQLVPWRRLQF